MKSTNITLGVGIMAVPERQALAANLLASLGLSAAHIAWDTNHIGHVPNWWRAVALACAPPATHALILEDDALPCRDFLSAVKNIVAQYPHRIISFFATNKMALPPTTNLSLVPHHGFSDVAVVYPVPWLQALDRDFAARQKAAPQPSYGADELRMKLRPQQKMWATYPSLVQHGAPTSSTLGHKFAHSVARPCLGITDSALALDWSQL